MSLYYKKLFSVNYKGTTMKIKIRLATLSDLNKLMGIFDTARRFMQSTGNANQWINGYPQRELIMHEINSGHCYVCINEQESVAGTFCFIQGPDPTYSRIDEGNWLDNDPYWVIHRIASDGSCRGIFEACINWCEKQTPNLRVDTHADNKIMQNLLEKHGFIRCGIIYVANGTPRIAYQRHNTSHS